MYYMHHDSYLVWNLETCKGSKYNQSLQYSSEITILGHQKRQLIHREVIENLVKIGLCKYFGYGMQVDMKVINL